MKIKELEIGQKVIINSFDYQYKGVQKIRTLTYGVVQKIVFERNTGQSYDYKYFDLPVGNKELKEVNGELTFK